MTSFAIKDVIGDGSCFFRSVYGAAKKKRGALKKIVTCFLDPDRLVEYRNDEELFVKDMRSHLSNRIKKRTDGEVIKNLYRSFRALSEEDYALVIDSMPAWMERAFPEKPKHEGTFRSVISKKVLEKSSWVSEVEVNIVRDTLKHCIGDDLHIVILNTKPDKKTFKMKSKTLYVLNIDEVHYNYLIKLSL